MEKRTRQPGMDFYQENVYLKWVVLAVSVLISIGSIYYTNVLIGQLRNREREQVKLFTRALEYTFSNSLDENLQFISEEILFKNNSIPIIWITRDGKYEFQNIAIDEKLPEKARNQLLKEQVEEMKLQYEPIEMTYRNDQGVLENYGLVYYKNSFLLNQLILYPYIQLSVIAIFAFISYLAFNYSKTAEQNRVWVGLAKETAHQLGTPLSSLMAWVEVLRDDPELSGRGIVEELDKDVRKLRVVTERFSSIGSTPVLKPENILQLVNNVVGYLQPRVSAKINFEVHTLSEKIEANVHAPLFEWVLENLCKNAVDAMGSTGIISIRIIRGSGQKVFIDITDTGKGMPRHVVANVFKPGFTTKKRGWGLGLALAKRIIEIYHNGRIYVKSSEENMGTTFRIELRSA
ncbi:MAG: HAMP domain-containing histidine kinase [Cyclobacteriaceae bacterium]|nr:HAMP domain-containing histidine kinase [Cyclobacteriaceae bacterium]